MVSEDTDHGVDIKKPAHEQVFLWTGISVILLQVYGCIVCCRRKFSSGRCLMIYPER
jgi:hypothetical protein